MPWKKYEGGYTKKGAKPGRGGFLKDPGQYEALREKAGMTKQQAAAIANSPHKVHRSSPLKKSATEIAKADRVAETSILVTPTSRREHLAKAYQQGTITQHQEQANLHARKKTSGRRQLNAGAAIASTGAAALAPGVSNEIAGRVRRVVEPGLRREHGPMLGSMKAGDLTVKVNRGVKHGGRAAVVGGAGLAAVGAVRAVHHGAAQNRNTAAAQSARKQRNAERSTVAKDAFGVEIIKDARDVGYRAGDATRRHDRALEAGSAAVSGGAAAGALRSARTARSARNEMTGAATSRDVAHSRVRERLQAHARKTGTTGHLGRTDAGMGLTARYANVGAHRAGAASDAATVARTATRRARGLSGLAVGAAATGVALHRREKPAPVTSHSYR